VGGATGVIAGRGHATSCDFREPQERKGRGKELNRRTVRVSLYWLGGLLLFVAAVVYAKQFVMGWPLSRTAVGLVVGGFACLWIASELKVKD